MNRKDFRPTDKYSSDSKNLKPAISQKEDRERAIKSGSIPKAKKKYRPYEKAYIKYKKEYGKNRSFKTYEEFAERLEKDRLELKREIAEEDKKYNQQSKKEIAKFNKASSDIKADKIFAKRKFPSDQSNSKVVKSDDVIYLDRY